MLNPFAEINWEPTVNERRKFALTLVIGFPCVALVLLLMGWLVKGHWQANLPAALWLSGGGVTVGTVLRAMPQIALPFYIVWHFVACCMGLVLGNLLLAGFFYLVLTPLGLAKRCLTKPTITKRFNREATTYWKDAGPSPEPERYYKQF
jgi:hypothetical protein